MQIKYFIFTFFSFVFFTTNISAQKDSTKESVQPDTVKYQNISVDQFKEMMNDEDIIILDVRTPEETTLGTIEGAITLNVLAEEFESQIQKLDKSKTYLVYCRSGRRSVKACNIMADSAFQNLYNLLGGYTGWSNK
jgi:rhodanese-related sulfurtransferase